MLPSRRLFHPVSGTLYTTTVGGKDSALQKPEFSPAEKQSDASLKATDKTASVFGASMGGRVFMAEDAQMALSLMALSSVETRSLDVTTSERLRGEPPD